MGWDGGHGDGDRVTGWDGDGDHISSPCSSLVTSLCETDEQITVCVEQELSEMSSSI